FLGAQLGNQPIGCDRGFDFVRPTAGDPCVSAAGFVNARRQHGHRTFALQAQFAHLEPGSDRGTELDSGRASEKQAAATGVAPAWEFKRERRVSVTEILPLLLSRRAVDVRADDAAHRAEAYSDVGVRPLPPPRLNLLFGGQCRLVRLPLYEGSL